MWWKEYKDYPHDQPVKKQTVETGKGIVGCEMHEVHGYGESFHKKRPSKNKGLLYSLSLLFSGGKK